MKNKSLLLAIALNILAISAHAQIKGTFKDTRDGKTYKTVKIDTQTWMAENLAYKNSSGCWVYNGDTANVSKYGYLYDWETSNKVCPTGWHLPSDAEWTVLTTYLGEKEVVGLKMKSTSGWSDYNGKTGNGTNTSGFTGLPGGYRNANGAYKLISLNSLWWSSASLNTENAWSRGLNFSNGKIDRVNGNKRNNFSVRCLKDF